MDPLTAWKQGERLTSGPAAEQCATHETQLYAAVAEEKLVAMRRMPCLDAAAFIEHTPLCIVSWQDLGAITYGPKEIGKQIRHGQMQVHDISQCSQ